MPFSSTELLLFVLACAAIGIVLYFVLRALDRAKDRPAVAALLEWAREEGLQLTRIRKSRGDAGRLGKLPRLYTVTVADASGRTRHAVVTLNPTFMGIDPGSRTVTWDTTAPDSLLGAEDLPVPTE